MNGLAGVSVKLTVSIAKHKASQCVSQGRETWTDKQHDSRIPPPPMIWDNSGTH